MTAENQNLNSVLLAQVAQAKEQNLLEDQSQDTFVSRTIPEGKAVGRLIGYVELGLQPQKFEGKPTDPAEEVMVTFELWNPPWNKDAGFSYEVDEKNAEGKPTGNKKVLPTRMTIRLTKKLNERSKFRKLHRKLTNGRPDNTNIAVLMSQGYLFDVKHEKSKDGKRTFATLYSKTEGYLIDRAVNGVDMATGAEQVIPVPPVTLDMQLFVQAMPTKEMWDSIYIDGEREQEQADGTKKMVSKNYIQETILQSLNYRGSRLELLLSGNEAAVKALVNATSEAPVAANPAVSAPVASQVSAPLQQTVVAPAQEVAAPLAQPQPTTAPQAEATVSAPAPAVATSPSEALSSVEDVMNQMFGPQA